MTSNHHSPPNVNPGPVWHDEPVTLPRPTDPPPADQPPDSQLPDYPPPTYQLPPPWAPVPRREVTARTFAIILAVWVLLIVGAAAWALAHPTPTERDQTTVAQARPVVDEAIARVATAVAAEGAGVVAVSGFDRVQDCDISVVRDGVRYQRALVVVVPPGTEVAVLDQVAAALPASYQPTVRRGDSPRLTADVGLFVLLSGSPVGAGELRFQADTGDCRPAGDLTAVDPETGVPADAVPNLLARLGLTATKITAAAVPCPGGGTLGTVEARAPSYGQDLGQALAGLGDVLVSEPPLFAYRLAAAQVAVRAQADATTVTVTSLC